MQVFVNMVITAVVFFGVYGVVLLVQKEKFAVEMMEMGIGIYEEKSKEIRAVLDRNNNNDEKMQTAGYLILSFFICFVPRIIFLKDVYPLSVTGDETFMFMPAATWAGLDWSGNVRDYRYYGYGFVALLTPV